MQIKDVNHLCQYTSIRFEKLIINIHNGKIFILLKECTKGWYGLDCKKQFSGHCRDNNTCNHVTGLCDGGCADGWKGVLCDKGILKLSFLKIF